MVTVSNLHITRKWGARAFIALLILVSSLNAYADHHAPDVCLGGCPVGSPSTNRAVDHEILRLSQNPTTKFADWVAYRITIESKTGPSRPRNFKGDPLVPNTEELGTADYTGGFAQININKGHQAPLASFKGSPHWARTNYMTNITPQQNDLNKGAWKQLEAAVRDLADYGYPVFVMTGPLYERDMTPLPQADQSHVIPSGYWKIIATEEEGEFWSAAFIFDQATAMSTSFCTGADTIAEIERRAGLDFFTTLGLDNELAIETGMNDLVPWMGCDE